MKDEKIPTGIFILAAVLAIAGLLMIFNNAQTVDPTESAAPAIFGVALIGMCLFLPIIWIIIAILIAVWVYKDAEKRGKNGALWLIICILIGLLGLIIYLLVRKSK